MQFDSLTAVMREKVIAGRRRGAAAAIRRSASSGLGYSPEGYFISQDARAVVWCYEIID